MRISDWSSDVCSSDLAVGGDHRHAVRHGMALHRAAPHAAGVEIGVIGLGPDRGRVEKPFGAHQRPRARGFGIPLIPAYPDAAPRSEDVSYLDASSEERPVGKECVSTCRSRWSPYL